MSETIDHIKALVENYSLCKAYERFRKSKYFAEYELSVVVK